MTISELIANLERVRAMHGDLDVLHHDFPESFVPAVPPEVVRVYRHVASGYQLSREHGYYEGDRWVKTTGVPTKAVLL